jgi:hypothetical protein
MDWVAEDRHLASQNLCLVAGAKNLPIRKNSTSQAVAANFRR